MKTHQLAIAAGLAFGLCACVTKTTEGPLAPGPVAASTKPPKPQQTSGPTVAPTPRPTPAPTPDPFASIPIPQKPLTPGVSPLSHGPDQPLYRRQ